MADEATPTAPIVVPVPAEEVKASAEAPAGALADAPAAETKGDNAAASGEAPKGASCQPPPVVMTL